MPEDYTAIFILRHPNFKLVFDITGMVIVFCFSLNSQWMGLCAHVLALKWSKRHSPWVAWEPGTIIEIDLFAPLLGRIGYN